MWYKVRYCSATRSKWHYVFIDDKINKNSIVKELEEKSNAPTWSDRYTGIEYSKVSIEKIPKEVINWKVNSAEREITFLKGFLDFYKKESKKCKVLEIKKTCKYCKGKRKVKIQDRIMDCFYCKDGTQKDYNVS